MSETAPNQVFSKRLDWKLSTTELFGCFSDQPWAILLDSANANHSDAHYDIICAAPIAVLVTQGDKSTLTRSIDRQPLFSLSPPLAVSAASGQCNPAEKVINSDDPFSLLSQNLQQLYPIAKQSKLPFSGGAMGSFSYDLGRRIENVPETATRDITLPEMNVGFYDWALIYDYAEQAWFLVHYVSRQALDTQYQLLSGFVGSRLKASEVKSVFKLTSDWQNQITESEYRQKFDKVQAYLHSGDCYQINLTQRFSASYTGDEWQAYLKLRSSNSAPFSAFIRLPRHTLLSISPERFVQLRGDKIQTKPIKGTMPRFSDPKLDRQSVQALIDSPKDRAENLMIVDLLRNDIGKVAKPGSVKVPHLFDIESFPAVHHLVSTVTAELDAQQTPADLLRAAFPGGSITGAPKIRAMEIIEELEPSRRSLYCGSIGYISQDGNMDTNITIRTLVTQQQQLYCWAGGGIVADSVAEAEFQESYDKVSRILPVLAGCK